MDACGVGNDVRSPHAPRASMRPRPLLPNCIRRPPLFWIRPQFYRSLEGIFCNSVRFGLFSFSAPLPRSYGNRILLRMSAEMDFRAVR
jgi:hypothetical protein